MDGEAADGRGISLGLHVRPLFQLSVHGPFSRALFEVIFRNILQNHACFYNMHFTSRARASNPRNVPNLQV